MLKKTSSLAALVLVAGLALTACGDKDEAADNPTSAPSAVAKPPADGGELTAENFAASMTAAQTAAKTSHVSMDLGVGGQSISAEGDIAIGATAADTALAMTMDVGSAGMGKLDMRVVDEVFYLNFGPMTQNKFVKIDLADKSNPIGKQYGQIIDQLDPSKQLEQFAQALKSFEKQGEPIDLDGVKAQPYVVSVDTKKLPGMADLAESGAAQLPETIDYTMFIGPDNLPRRIVTDVVGSKVTIDYSKWGEDVDITAPAAGEVSDMDLGQLMGSVPTPTA